MKHYVYVFLKHKTILETESKPRGQKIAAYRSQFVRLLVNFLIMIVMEVLENFRIDVSPKPLLACLSLSGADE